MTKQERYKLFRERADEYLPLQIKYLEDTLGIHDWIETDSDTDRHDKIDLIGFGGLINVSVRIRDIKYRKFKDMTFRQSEIEHLALSQVDYYLYGYVDGNTPVDWILVNGQALNRLIIDHPELLSKSFINSGDQPTVLYGIKKKYFEDLIVGA